MKNQTDQYNDQAEQLKQIFNELNKNENQDENVLDDMIEQDQIQHIDILNLPPRKTVHSHKKTGLKVKFSRPFVRLLFVTILIIALIITFSYLSNENLLNFP